MPVCALPSSLATYNGMAEAGAWLDEQVDLCAAQAGVTSLVVYDDVADGRDVLHLRGACRVRSAMHITILPSARRYPRDCGNSLHL